MEVFVLILLAGGMSSLAKARRVNPYLAVVILLACYVGGAVGGIAYHRANVRAGPGAWSQIIFLYAGSLLASGLAFAGVALLPTRPARLVASPGPIQRTCPRCNVELPAGASLCPGCGIWAD